MVFDYAEFDLTGLMESQQYKFTEAQVRLMLCTSRYGGGGG